MIQILYISRECYTGSEHICSALVLYTSKSIYFHFNLHFVHSGHNQKCLLFYLFINGAVVRRNMHYVLERSSAAIKVFKQMDAKLFLNSTRIKGVGYNNQIVIFCGFYKTNYQTSVPYLSSILLNAHYNCWQMISWRQGCVSILQCITSLKFI